jgi:hypothetical protein
MRMKVVRLLPFVALLTVGAALVFPGFAAAEEFHAELNPSDLEGLESTDAVLTVNGRTITCSEIVWVGITPEDAVETSLTPGFEPCNGFGRATTATAQGCEFVLSEPVARLGSASIICPPGDKITFSVGGGACTVTIGSEAIEGGMSYKNDNSSELNLAQNRDITMEFGLTGLTATVSGSVLICGTNGARTLSWSGAVTMEAFVPEPFGPQVGTWLA